MLAMKIEHKIIIITLFSAVFVWIVDALGDFFLLYRGTFWEIMIFGATPNSIYGRSMMVICFLLAGLLASRIVMRREQTERALKKSEQRFKAVFNTVIDAILLADVDDKKLLIGNKAICRMLGYSLKEIENSNIANIHPEESLPYVMEQFEKQARGEIALAKDIPVKKKDGSIFYADISASPVTLEGKKCLIGIFRDITERRETERKLQESEESYRDLWENINDLVQSVAPDGSFKYVNKAWLRTLGYSREEASKLSLVDIIHPDGRAHFMEIFKRVLSGENVRNIEARFVARDGRTIMVEGSANCRFQEGRPVVARTIFRDVTQDKFAEMGSKEKTRDLAERVKELDCLFGLAELINRPDISLEGIFRGAVNLIPPAWQFSEAACARVIFEDDEFRTEGFKTTVWKQASDIMVNGEKAGAVEVYYLEEMPKSGEGPFLNEKRALIDAVAERLGSVVERKLAEDALLESREKYQTLARISPVGVFHADTEGSYTYLNDRLCEIAGLTMEEAIGKGWESAVHPDDRKRVFDTWYQCARGKRSFKLEYRFQRPDGRVTWGLGQATVEKNVKGEVIGYVGTITDITSHKKMEELLHAAYTEFRQIFDSAASGMCIIDKHLNIIRVNNAFLKLFQLDHDRVVRKKCYDIFRCLEKDTAVCTMAKMLAGEESHEKEFERKRGDGTTFTCIVSAVPFRDSDGEVVGVLENFKDITERKKIEESQRFAQLGRLASGMAHEINNPMMIIYGRAQLSMMEISNQEKMEENLRIINEQCERTKNIIQKVYAYSQSGKGEVRDVDINGSLEKVIDLVEYQFLLKNIKIKRDLMQPSPHAKIDEKQIQEVFMNLLTNAADAMQLGGDITISTSEEMGDVRIDFKDSGEGIPEENLERIFDPFFSTRDLGTGLGLSISRSIIKAHDGELTFTSKTRAGTTATILLPLCSTP